MKINHKCLNVQANFDGQTLSHFAANYNHKHNVEFLVSERADVNVHDNKDQTPDQLSCVSPNIK